MGAPQFGGAIIPQMRAAIKWNSVGFSVKRHRNSIVEILLDTVFKWTHKGKPLVV